MKDNETSEFYTASIHLIEGRMAFHIDCFGDYIAKREKYKKHKGMDAVHFYLIQKYHWLPSQVKSLSFEDLRFLLEEEMSGWHPPASALVAARRAAKQHLEGR
jgi:hypothetical protein